MKRLFSLLLIIGFGHVYSQEDNAHYVPVQGEITPELQALIDSADFNLAEDLTYPHYPNGMNGVIEDIIKHFKYPKKAKKEGIEGKAYVSFVVEKDGNVRQAEVLNEVNEMLADEAIRVVKLLDRWKPATLDGEPVRMAFVIPINFKL